MAPRAGDPGVLFAEEHARFQENESVFSFLCLCFPRGPSWLSSVHSHRGWLFPTSPLTNCQLPWSTPPQTIPLTHHWLSRHSLIQSSRYQKWTILRNAISNIPFQLNYRRHQISLWWSFWIFRRANSGCDTLERPLKARWHWRQRKLWKQETILQWLLRDALSEACDEKESLSTPDVSAHNYGVTGKSLWVVSEWQRILEESNHKWVSVSVKWWPTLPQRNL